MLRPKCPDTAFLLSAVSVTTICALLPSAVFAQNSLGIGAGEAAVPSAGLSSGALAWINSMQQAFYRSLTGALKAMRDDPTKLWILIGLSFAYGVFHAAGPGHGKAVISSYMLANEIVLRRGILLSFLSALAQGATALVVMGLVFLLFRGTSVSMSDAAGFLEVASYALIAGFGAWLLWRKAGRYLRRRAATVSLPAADTGHFHGRIRDHGPPPGDGDLRAACRHAHAPDPMMLKGDDFDWKSAWTAIAAVGIRPCSGALIVLTFAFLNRLWLGGIASVLAMSIGTAITVSMLASMAVLAKSAAMRVSGHGAMGNAVHSAIEIAGALLILLIGALLLSARLNA